MTETAIAHPPIATRAEWLEARLQLLAEEKEHTKQYDRINAKRRRLPMVKVDKDYTFEGPDGMVKLTDLFGDKRQLIVQHFMFGPDWDEGCPGCTGFVNALGNLSYLGKRETRLVLVSRAPLEKLEAYKSKYGWTLPWYSTNDSDFSYDFGVTLDPNRGAMTFNYKSGEELEKSYGKIEKTTELPGFSVFFRLGDDVYHTYSTYARGGEGLTEVGHMLDITPYGRQEDFEDSPAGWPQYPTYG